MLDGCVETAPGYARFVNRLPSSSQPSVAPLAAVSQPTISPSVIYCGGDRTRTETEYRAKLAPRVKGECAIDALAILVVSDEIALIIDAENSRCAAVGMRAGVTRPNALPLSQPVDPALRTLVPSRYCTAVVQRR